tara:strand:+ start:1354 stop:2223 length:870 start_codon:yes stop_codon:yes gene_type:complete
MVSTLHKSPLVSVVMPIYQATLEMVESSVSCILRQTFLDFEFIIVDDRNSARVTKFLDSLPCRDARIRVLKNIQNIGITRSLIIAINGARGKYISRQDVDDFSKPSRLEQQVLRLEYNNDIALLGTWYEVLDRTGRIIRKWTPDNDAIIRRSLFLRNPFCHASTMFRKDIYDLVGGYDAQYTYSQDLDLWIRIGERGVLAMVEDYLVLRTVHDGAISTSSSRWQQVWNSCKIRLLHCHKIGCVRGVFFSLLATVYHVLHTLLPQRYANVLSSIIEPLRPWWLRSENRKM